jgi:hypothetical protein
LLDRHELALDERAHLGEERGDVRRDVEVHGGAIPPSAAASSHRGYSAKR